MIGVVGNLKICYTLCGYQHEEIIDPKTTSEFCLKNCPEIKFRIEEITYIEDTVYGVVLSLISPQYREDEYLVGSDTADFVIEEFGAAGYFSLCFKGESL